MMQALHIFVTPLILKIMSKKSRNFYVSFTYPAYFFLFSPKKLPTPLLIGSVSHLQNDEVRRSENIKNDETKIWIKRRNRKKFWYQEESSRVDFHKKKAGIRFYYWDIVSLSWNIFSTLRQKHEYTVKFCKGCRHDLSTFSVKSNKVLNRKCYILFFVSIPLNVGEIEISGGHH